MNYHNLKVKSLGRDERHPQFTTFRVTANDDDGREHEFLYCAADKLLADGMPDLREKALRHFQEVVASKHPPQPAK